MQVYLHIAEAIQYIWPSGQIYAEAESNASSLVIAEAQQYIWYTSAKYTQKPRAMQVYLHIAEA